MNNTNNMIETYRGGRSRGSTTSGSYRGAGGDYRGSSRVSSVGSSINYSSSSSSIIEKYRGGRSGSSGGGRGSGGSRSSSGGRSGSRGSRGSSRSSSRSSNKSSNKVRSSSKGTSYTPKISGGSFRPSFGVNFDNYYSGKHKPGKPHEKKVKPIESSYRQTSTSHTMGVYGGTPWFGWGPTVLYTIIDEPPEIIASMNDNNIEKKETMSISEYDEKIRKKI
jgi:hypothetical protein